jgi:hypothetical protein
MAAWRPYWISHGNELTHDTPPGGDASLYQIVSNYLEPFPKYSTEKKLNVSK